MSRTIVGVDLPDVDTSTTRYFSTVNPVGSTSTRTGVLVLRRRVAAGRVRVRSRGQLRQGVATRDHRRGNAVRLGPVAEGSPARAGRPASVVYSTPLMTWRPVIGATGYEVSGRARSTWRARGSVLTYATSSALQLGSGIWYYRVRGLNAAQVGTPE